VEWDGSALGRDGQVIASSPQGTATTAVPRTPAFASALLDELATRTDDGRHCGDNVVLGYD